MLKRINAFHALLGGACAALVSVMMAGCPQNMPDPNDPNTVVDPNGELPSRTIAECANNTTPIGTALFPASGESVFNQAVRFGWQVFDADGDVVRGRVFVSQSPDVFNAPLITASRLSNPNDLFAELTFAIDEPGEYYWGVEIDDGCTTVRRPADGNGLRFLVTTDEQDRQPERLIPLCPRDTQPARARTVFQWEPLDVAPTRAQVFVSRADQANPFDEPLRVFEVTPPTQNFRQLSADEALVVGDTYNWGLRIQTADGVFFAPSGTSGIPFTVQENVPPTGNLVDPPNGAIFSDDGAPFVLRWTADPGNCEDILTSQVFLEFLGNASAPSNLFGSSRVFTVDAGALELNLRAALGSETLPAGRWAWGVRASDDADSLELPASENEPATFRTFVRDPAPFFVNGPTQTPRDCTPIQQSGIALLFSYDDESGASTVQVRVVFGSDEATLFDNPAAQLTLPASATGADLAVFVSALDGDACAQLPNGPGLYGVELNDGVNPPVRRTINVDYPDCNRNTIPDDIDPALIDTADCNENGVPDVCDIIAGTSNDCDNNNQPDECQPDCDGDGVPDVCAIGGGAPDCNQNGIPDSCDIASGRSRDNNGNGVPDECEDIGLLGGSDQTEGRLLDLDEMTGRATPISGPGLHGVSDIRGVAYDALNDIWYLADRFELYTLDPATGALRVIGGLGVGENSGSFIDGIAFSSSEGVLYGIAGSQLVRIDPSNGLASTVGAVVGTSIADLTYDASRNVLLAVSDSTFSSPELIEVDLNVSPPTVQSVGAINIPGQFVAEVQGIARDTVNGLLYAFLRDGESQQSVLSELIDDPNAPGSFFAQTAQISPLFLTAMAMEFDPTTGSLRIATAPEGQTFAARQLRSWSPAAALDPGDFLVTGAELIGLAFDAQRDVLFGLDDDMRALLEINRETAQPSLRTFLGAPVEGLRFVDLAYSRGNGALAALAEDGTYVEINPDSGSLNVRNISPSSLSAAFASCAFDPNGETLYAMGRPAQSGVQTLLRSFVGAPGTTGDVFYSIVGTSTFADAMDFDPVTGDLIAFDSGRIARVNRDNGAVVATTRTGLPLVSAIALDEGGARTWVAGRTLFEVNPQTVQVVGEVGMSIYGLTADRRDNTLYAFGYLFSEESPRIARVDRATGEAELLVSPNASRPTDLIFDDANDRLLLMDDPNGVGLYDVNLANGDLTLVETPMLPFADSASYDPISATAYIGGEFGGDVFDPQIQSWPLGTTDPLAVVTTTDLLIPVAFAADWSTEAEDFYASLQASGGGLGSSPNSLLFRVANNTVTIVGNSGYRSIGGMTLILP